LYYFAIIQFFLRFW